MRTQCLVVLALALAAGCSDEADSESRTTSDDGSTMGASSTGPTSSGSDGSSATDTSSGATGSGGTGGDADSSSSGGTGTSGGGEATTTESGGASGMAGDGGGGGSGGMPSLEGLSCAELQQVLEAELTRIQSCEDDDECGQEIQGSSCGCTRNLVARSDAVLARFAAIVEAQANAECGGLVSTCDCPAADGFACVAGRCNWNYL